VCSSSIRKEGYEQAIRAQTQGVVGECARSGAIESKGVRVSSKSNSEFHTGRKR